MFLFKLVTPARLEATMLRITIFAVGKLKEQFWKDAVAEYLKRLGGYAKIEVRELPDSNAEKEASALLSALPERGPIILMDIRMPEVNGYEATEAIRQMSATVPIIALTAFAYEEDRQKIMHSGFTDFLTKPISSRILLGKLESLKKI